MSLTKGQKSRAVWAFFVVLRPFLLQTGMPALCLDSQGGKGKQQGWHTTAATLQLCPSHAAHWGCAWLCHTAPA